MLTNYVLVLGCWAALAAPLSAAGPIVLLIGPPGSGRTTQAERLKNERKMLVISADDLIARNQRVFERPKPSPLPEVDPHLEPALNPLVEGALWTADLSKGVVLDGYPATKGQADFLAGLREKLNLPRPLVIHLRVPDQVVRKRLKKKKVPDLDQQLKDYHRELAFAREYFPLSDIHDVDGTKKPGEVAKQIRALLQAGTK